MSGLRVNTGAKRIEVNDAGEYIVLNFGDQSFPTRVFDMMDRIKEKAEQASAEEKEIREKHPEGEDLIRVMTKFNEEIHRYMMREVDSVFGPETCRKVFGDIVPGIDLFEDFFNQLMPYFEDYAKERATKMSKYSAGRTGNV